MDGSKRSLASGATLHSRAWLMRPGAFLALVAMLSNPIVSAIQARTLLGEGPTGVTRPNPGKYTGKRQSFPKPTNGNKLGMREKVMSRTQREDLAAIHEIHRLRQSDRSGTLACLNPSEFFAILATTPHVDNRSGAMPWDGNVGGVNTNTGAFATTVPIISWPTKGNLSIDFELIHNSRGNLEPTMWGPNWKSNYDIFLNKSGSTMYVEYADGTTAAFSISGNSASPPAGFYDSLSYNPTAYKWTMTSKDQTQYEFEHDTIFDPDFWFLTKITDRFGNTILVNRGDEGKLDSVVDGADSSRKIQIGISAFTKTITFTPLSRTWTVHQDGTDRITSVDYPAPVSGTGPSRTFTYSSSYGDRIATDTDRRSHTTSYTYQTSGNDEGAILTRTEPGSRVTTYSYPSDSETDMVDANGYTVTHEYNSSGQLCIVTDESGFSSAYWTRDSNGNVTQFLPGNFTELNYTYDSMGNMLTAEDQLYHTDTWTYNSTNDMTSYTNDAGKTWQFVYYGTGTTAPGALEKVLDPLYASRTYPQERYVYDSAGQLIEAYDGLNYKTSYTRNSHGDVTTVTSPDGTYSSLDYGSGAEYTKNLGLPYYSTSKAGVTTGLKYDAWKRVTDVYVGDSIGSSHTGDHTTIAYDNESNVTSVTDANGHQSTYAYNDNDEVSSATDALNKTETYTRDDMGQVISVTDRNGHTRTYDYTERGELWKITLPDHPSGLPSEEWSYDNATGAVTAYTPATNQTVNYAYDDAVRLTTIDFPSGTDTTFSYDTRNRRTQMVDSTGTTTWSYNDADEMTQIAQPNGTISYTWRDNGQANTRTEPGSVVTTFSYDSYGRPTQMARAESGGWNDTTSYTYDSAGRINKQTFGNSTYEQYGYDSRSRLSSVTLKNSSNTTLRTQTMNYDAVGNLSSKAVDSVTTSYTYDDIDQLLSESRSGWSQEYTYDWNGNRLTKKLNGTTVQSFSYDSSDKLIANAYGTITYDAAGRPTAYPTASGTRTFEWDYDSRLTGMSAPGSSTITTHHTYNGMGARVGTSNSSWSRSDLRSGTSVLAPVVSSSSSNSSQAAKYVPGVAERRNSVNSWNHAGLSNTDSQSSSSQAVSATREYDAYGNIVNSSGTFNGPFGYAGKFGYDSGEGSLQLVGNRWYDPEVGRFITRDPAHEGGNWYAYCGNNPLKRVDPSGLEWHDPGVVYVDPGFDGYVIVIGEDEGSGDDQVSYTLHPGEHSNPHVDVDVIIVVHKDGTVEVYAFFGWATPWVGYEDPQLATVGKDGTVRGPNVVTVHTDLDVYEAIVLWAFANHADEHWGGRHGRKYPPRSGYPDMAAYEKGLNPNGRPSILKYPSTRKAPSRRQ